MCLRIAFLSQSEREQLLNAVEAYQHASAHDHVSAEDQAMAVIQRIIVPPLPESVKTLRDLESYAREFRKHAKRTLKAKLHARPAFDPGKWMSAFHQACRSRGLKTPVHIAQACGLAVPTITAIIAMNEPPGSKVREVIEDALKFHA